MVKGKGRLKGSLGIGACAVVMGSMGLGNITVMYWQYITTVNKVALVQVESLQ